MQPLRYSINVTLDGCVDHRAGEPDDAVHRNAAEGIARADSMLLGRVTYGMMEDAWRAPGETGVPADWMEPWMMPFARTIHGAKKYVVSSTLPSVDWNAELVRGDLETFVRELKEQPGRGIATGGVTLPTALAELGLIDEYELVVHPRIAGHGPWLLEGLTKPLRLELVERRELKNGIVSTRYVRRGV